MTRTSLLQAVMNALGLATAISDNVFLAVRHASACTESGNTDGVLKQNVNSFLSYI